MNISNEWTPEERLRIIARLCQRGQDVLRLGNIQVGYSSLNISRLVATQSATFLNDNKEHIENALGCSISEPTQLEG